jgi:hypothetical protein
MLRFIDSFDHYATADIGTKWTTVGASPTINSSAGRRSGGCLACPSGANYVRKTLDNQATFIVGFALYINTLPSVTSTSLVEFFDGATAQFTFAMTTAGAIDARRGAYNGTSLGTSVNTFSTGTWYYIEAKVTINNTTGVVEFRVNGSNTNWLNLSSQNTRAGSNNYASIVQAGFVVSASASIYIDDLYILDAQGSTNNNFLGDVRVDAYLPNGNGNYSQFTGSDSNSTDNYLLVDDTTPNGDTDYVQSDTVGNYDTYAMTDMSHTPSSIYGVQVSASCKKDDAGSRSIALCNRSNSTDSDGTTTALGTSYQILSHVFETDGGHSGVAWTKANFNSAEFGVKVAA